MTISFLPLIRSPWRAYYRTKFLARKSRLQSAKLQSKFIHLPSSLFGCLVGYHRKKRAYLYFLASYLVVHTGSITVVHVVTCHGGWTPSVAFFFVIFLCSEAPGMMNDEMTFHS